MNRTGVRNAFEQEFVRVAFVGGFALYTCKVEGKAGRCDMGKGDPLTSSPVVANTMSEIRRRDTKLELRVRRELHRRGLRFRVDYGPAPGRPDIALTRAKVSVFLDGCFWHGCPLHGTWPKSNTDWWKAKTGRTSSAMPGSANSLKRRDGSFSATGRMTTSTTSATRSRTCGGTAAGFCRFVVGHAKLMGS